MKRHLPPLMALRAFDAAARHMSFSAAAEELHVTQSAISRQIKLLEQFLGQPLFERLTRQVALTAFGHAYLDAVSSALDTVERATRLSRQPARTTLRISLPQSLASVWLMPRLSSFTELYPDIDVRVSASMHPADFRHDQIDVAIRLGRMPGRPYQLDVQPRVPHELVTDWTGVTAYYLWDEVLTPILSKTLLAQGAPLDTPDDLRRYRLLHVALRPDAWSDWFRSQGAIMPAAASMEFGHFFMALEAARHGSGVALTPKLFIDGLDKRDELICPFDSSTPSAGAYYLLCRESETQERKVLLLCDWLIAEGQAHRQPG